MNTAQNMWGGFQSDEDESLKISPSNLEFGLNERVVLTQFEYSTKTGSGGSEGNPALLINLNVNGTDRNTRIYDPTIAGGRVWYRGKEVLDRNSPDFAAGTAEAVKQAKSNITHFIKASGKTDEQIQVAFSAGITSFADLVRIAAGLLAETIASRKPLHLFLQYQPKITGSAEQTYLDIPNNLSYGAYLCAAIPAVGSWKAQTTWVEKDENQLDTTVSGLRYVDDEGNIHRFTRDEGFMKSKVASIQTKGAITPGNPTPVTPGQAEPKKAAW